MSDIEMTPTNPLPGDGRERVRFEIMGMAGTHTQALVMGGFFKELIEKHFGTEVAWYRVTRLEDFEETHPLIVEGYFDRVADTGSLRIDQLAKKVQKGTNPNEGIILRVEVGPVPVRRGVAIGPVPHHWGD